MKIDAHNHAQWLYHNYNETLKDMDAEGIDKSFLMSWICPRDEYSPSFDPTINNPREGGPLDFSYAIDYWEKAPDRFLLGFAPDPRRPGAVEALRDMARRYPIQMCGEIKLRMMYDNFDAISLFRCCGELGLPVMLHLDYPLPVTDCPRDNYWYGGDIHTLERVLAACPETNFIGHAPGFWSHISNDDLAKTCMYPEGPVIPGGEIERLLSRYQNLYCDISAGSGCNALSRDKAYSRELILTHPTRFLYGRDQFDSSHTQVLESLGLPEEVLSDIYAENLLRIIPQ